MTSNYSDVKAKHFEVLRKDCSGLGIQMANEGQNKFKVMHIAVKKKSQPYVRTPVGSELLASDMERDWESW